MSERGLRAQSTAKLILLYIRDAPMGDDSFNGKEQTLLSHVGGKPYSALAIKCASEQEAKQLRIRCDMRGIANMQLRYTVGYPTIMYVEIIDIYVRHGCQFATVREYVEPGTPNESRIRGSTCYLIFYMQPVVYQDVLLGIRNKPKS